MNAVQKVALSVVSLINAMLVIFLATCSAPARAETPCEEWANMTKILVMRWQRDPQFVNVSLTAAQIKLGEMMGNHPEINTALKYVEFAYKHRDEDPVEVWKLAFASCAGTI